MIKIEKLISLGCSLGLRDLFTRNNPKGQEQTEQTRVVGYLSRRDFANLRSEPGFRAWACHRDFAVERDAFRIGLDSAGVSTRLQMIPSLAFKGWARLTGAGLDIDGLDEFAAHWAWRMRHPAASTRGALGLPLDPDHPAGVAGVQQVCIRETVFAQWLRDCQDLTPLVSASLDVYAALVIECCIPVKSGKLRRSVKQL